MRNLLPASEARYNGSRERIIGANGEINAGSQKEAIDRLVEIAAMISKGDLITTEDNPMPELSAAQKTEKLREAYHSTNNDWAELGAALAFDIDTRVEREGFMRSVLARGDIADNSIARVRIRERNVNAIVTKGIGQVYPQYLRDKYHFLDEFYITSQPRIEELDLHQGSADLLDDKYFEGLEAILVAEDRTLVKMFRAADGAYNDVTYFSGQFSQSILEAVKRKVDGWGIPATTALLSMDLLGDIRAGSNFSTWFDPITKWEIIRTGRIGSLFGLTIMTDGYRETKLRVLNDGEFFILGTPEYIGGYTDRGPVQSRAVDEFDKFVPARGWTMHEIIGMIVANGKAVARGQRSA